MSTLLSSQGTWFYMLHQSLLWAIWVQALQGNVRQHLGWGSKVNFHLKVQWSNLPLSSGERHTRQVYGVFNQKNNWLNQSERMSLPVSAPSDCVLCVLTSLSLAIFGFYVSLFALFISGHFPISMLDLKPGPPVPWWPRSEIDLLERQPAVLWEVRDWC